MLIFQSTLPRRERPLLLILLKDGEHFNPRSHEGSDQEPHNIYFQPCISIHAPTKGATVPIAYHFLFIYVFQSTLPRRERPISAIFEMSFDSFQSTLPREERHYRLCNRPYGSKISIHAPARGATAEAIRIRGSGQYFNPRSRERSDKSFHFMLFVLCNFNPRSRERSDQSCIKCLKSLAISIHAPARGATIIIMLAIKSSEFQSTLPREERLCRLERNRDFLYFNPRSRERSDD